MKKTSTAALIAAIAISAGSLGAQVMWGTAGGSGADTGSELTANVTSNSTSQELADGSAEGTISYESALEELYERSTEISDTEIREIAQRIVPDISAVEKQVGGTAAAAVSDALTAYEDAKASYILDEAGADSKTNTDSTADLLRYSADKGISGEWKRQSDYTQDGLTDSETLVSLYPAFTITDCSSAGSGAVTVDIDEWMTQGYTEGTDSPTENISAYRYYYTATLREQSGSWAVISVSNTDQNYTWLDDMQEQEEEYSIAQEDFGETGESTQKDAKSAIATSNLEIYGGGAYKYSADKAIAYADKWATSRNSQYRSYPGVDCSNFVSQCLYAGGIPVSSRWYPASYCWVNCMGAISYYKNFGTFLSANNSNVLKGNPVYYDWNSNGVYDHTAICVGRNSSGTPIVDAHTSDRYHASWKLSSRGTRATIQLRQSGTYTDNSTTSKVGYWQKTNGKWYYLTDAGVPVSGWLRYSGRYYYLSGSGEMQTGWQKVNNVWYYLASGGIMQTGWQKINSKWYYFNGSGAMQTGWQKIGGKWYYLASGGAMCTGWQKIGGKWYYLASDGAMQTGLQLIGGERYYLGAGGAMEYGWKDIGGKKYYFSLSRGGKAVKEPWQIDGKTYYFGSDGVLKQ